jgi:hypothetical protein
VLIAPLEHGAWRRKQAALAAPWGMAPHLGVPRHHAWRRTIKFGTHDVTVAVLPRRREWRGTIFCGALEHGAAKKG